MPAAPFVSVELLGQDALELKLLRGAAAVSNMRPALVEVRLMMFAAIAATFESQGRRYGGSWQHLTTEWIARKVKAGLDPRILIARGRLMESFTNRDSPYMRSKVTRTSISLGSTLPYAAAQNFGSPAAGIPQREFISFHPRDRQRWVTSLEKYVMAALSGV
jgi:phage gpG-like protein